MGVVDAKPATFITVITITVIISNDLS